MIQTPASPGTSSADYSRVRAITDALTAPLSAEDQQVQSEPDVSPTKWHRAHTTWFFETFLLLEHLEGYEPFDPEFMYLYNSYYEAVGDRHPRHLRGLITRPTVEQIGAYRRHVDEAMRDLIDTVATTSHEVADLVVLGLHHEQQHQELLLMDIKHVLSVNPTRPRYHELALQPSTDLAATWIGFDGGVVEVGHPCTNPGFHFDNEGPRHRQFLEPFELCDRPVTNGEWLDFMSDGGYENHEHWLSAGWASVQTEKWNAPLYWDETSAGWHAHTLHGFEPVDPNEPVCHISYFEADAYARWANARLPTEFEWEHAAQDVPTEGNLGQRARYHPEPAAVGTGSIRQMFGDVWEWTASSYSPYPGFTAAPGAVGEYNGKFMVNQYVLRGGSCVTPSGHIRSTYRNFFPAHSRWVFSGLRLARNR